MNRWQGVGLSAIAICGLAVSAGTENWRVVVIAEGVGLSASLLYLDKNKSPWKEIRKTEAKYFRQHEEAKKIRAHTEQWVEKYKAGQLSDIARRREELEQQVEELEKLLEELEAEREEEENQHKGKLEKLTNLSGSIASLASFLQATGLFN